MLAKNMVSSVSGHSHLADVAIRARPDGSKLIGLNCGCYLEEPTYEDSAAQLWWKGLMMLRDMKDGMFDLEMYSIERIKKEYS